MGHRVKDGRYCTRCPERARPGKATCADCGAKQVAAQETQRAKRRANRQCIVPGCEDPPVVLRQAKRGVHGHGGNNRCKKHQYWKREGDA